MHVFVLLPPLEQAPDQMALRPFETLSVIDVLAPNDAEAALPTATLIPAGLDETVSPLRPVAVTVSAAVRLGGAAGGGASGFTVKRADLVTPPPDTDIVTTVCADTCVVKMLKPPCVTPAGTITLLFT